MRNIKPLALVLLLCACTTISVDEDPQNVAASNAVQIAPGVSLSMPSPADLGRSVEATQLVTAHYGDQTFAFEAHINATPERFLLVGLDLMGRTLMTIDWTRHKISYETAPWVPAQLRPENILADIVLLYWPDSAVKNALAKSSGKLVTASGVRTIMSGDKQIWQANYASKPKDDPWSGQLHYRNLAWGYDFTVQSTEEAP